MTSFPKCFSKQFWWGYRWSLYRLCWCAMTSCFGRWWKPVWFSKKIFLNFSSNLDGTLSRLEFSEPDLLQKIVIVHLRFLELSPIWSRSPPSRWALRCGILTRLFFSTCSRSATIRVPFQTSLPAYQTYSRSDSGNTVLPNWWNFNRSRTEMEW